jgi:hypothetical protein
VARLLLTLHYAAMARPIASDRQSISSHGAHQLELEAIIILPSMYVHPFWRPRILCNRRIWTHMHLAWNALARWGARRRHDVPIQFGTLAISSRTE